MTLQHVSLVVPVYNSAETIPLLVDRIEAAARGKFEFELVLVNDGSRDGSWTAITAAAATRPWVRGIDLMRNFGQHNALLAGIRAAAHPIIVTLDDDLQNPPEEIPGLLEKLQTGVDVVYGVPQKQQHGLARDLASTITKLALQQAMGAETARNISAFRAFRTDLREAFAGFHSPSVNIDVLLTWATTRFAMLPVKHAERRAGTSQYTMGKLVAHAFNMMTGFSTLPLQFASFVGFLFTIFGIGVLVYVLGRYFIEGGSMPGFPFLASITAIFSGAQLLCLGIIGEYLARMHFRMLDKPPYVTRSSTTSSE